jgi:hypothetical protein
MNQIKFETKMLHCQTQGIKNSIEKKLEKCFSKRYFLKLHVNKKTCIVSPLSNLILKYFFTSNKIILFTKLTINPILGCCINIEITSLKVN